MNLMLWVLGFLFLITGAFVMSMNWAIFVNNYILKKQWTSAVPFVGGVMVALGLVFLPIDNLEPIPVSVIQC
jgi:hypothetical protein